MATSATPNTPNNDEVGASVRRHVRRSVRPRCWGDRCPRTMLMRGFQTVPHLPYGEGAPLMAPCLAVLARSLELELSAVPATWSR